MCIRVGAYILQNKRCIIDQGNSFEIAFYTQPILERDCTQAGNWSPLFLHIIKSCLPFLTSYSLLGDKNTLEI
jgi:hypothetical protein